MKANTLVWLTVFVGLVLALSATGLRGLPLLLSSPARWRSPSL